MLVFYFVWVSEINEVDMKILIFFINKFFCENAAFIKRSWKIVLLSFLNETTMLQKWVITSRSEENERKN